MSMMTLSRRALLGGAAAVGALTLSDPRPALAQAARRPARSSRLPGRGEYVIRGAYVMTMDRQRGDLANADIHVKDGAIVAVGAGLSAPGAQRIDGRDHIALPGFVETHWHMWNTLLRSMAGDKKELGYFPTTAALGKFFMPQDMYHGTRLASAEAVMNGITFVHDWCHNIRSPAFAEENLQALAESGLRGRFSYGTPQGIPVGTPIDIADFERLARQWTAWSADGRLALGLAWRGTRTFGQARTETSWRAELEAARRNNLPLSVHVGMVRGPNDNDVGDLADRKLLAKDIQLIHVTHVTEREVAAIASSGASASLSPFTELRTGFGIPPTGALLAAGIPTGLSIDTTELSGNADFFAIMKAIQNVEDGIKESEFQLPPRRVIELATIEGARSMLVDDQIGSLVSGKRADLILIDTSDVNMGLFTDPAHMIVEAAAPWNVDLVMIDGRILKRGRTLTAVDTKEVVAGARAALAGVKQRAGWTS